VESFVSILIPAFNAERWIAETITSALRQTWSRKELIVVDDGSTDQTLSIARKFASQSLLVVTQPNQGASAARNKALSLSQGDYIQWLDADDLLAPDKITRQMEAVYNGLGKRTLLSSAWGRFIYRTSKAKFTPTSLWCDLSPVEWLIRRMGQSVFMQTGTWLVSRELCEAAGPWDSRMLSNDDGEFFCRVILKCDRIRFVPEARVLYRITPAGRLSYVGRSDEKKDSLLLSLRLYVKNAQSLEDSDRVRGACIKFLQNSLIFFYPERPDIFEELKQLVASLGGTLKEPRLCWKYAWIKTLFGWGPAKAAQLMFPQLKSSLIRSWDKAMYHLEGRNRSSNVGV
jgi:glycosyltransferase involved in cell wall biosynthesis